MIYKQAYWFVAIVFVVLWLAFLASSASIMLEFQGSDGPAMLIAHSHLFLFFPIMGALALFAFYKPSVVFTDLYWQHLQLGRLRFAIGTCVIAALSIYLAGVLNNASLRAVWEVAPSALDAPQRSTAPGASAAQHRPVRPVLTDLMHEGSKRMSISMFARNCKWDDRVERPQTDTALRYCIPAGKMLDTDQCCRAQRSFRDHVSELWANSATRSKAADLDRILMPFKVFFVLVLLCVGCFLAIWRNKLRQHYAAHIAEVEKNVMIGALAMLLWPLMDYGYQQTSDVMFGREYAGINLRMSLVFTPWAALLLLYFVDFGKDTGRITQISTIVGGAVAVLRYQEINDLSARLLGSGAHWLHFAALAVVAIAGLGLVLRPVKQSAADRRGRPIT